MVFKTSFLTCVGLLLMASRASAEVRLPALIGDNMVLQSGTKARIWGWADRGEKVTVTFQNQSVSTPADAKGAWEVFLSPTPASRPIDMRVAGKNTIVVRNILVGEVWVVAGQSNIWWPVHRTTNADREMAQANYPKLRLFTVPIRVSQKPLADLEDKNAPTDPPMPQPEFQARWVECSTKTISWFSGVGYYFGRDLHQELKTPVGIIALGVAGTVIEAWTSERALQSIPEGQSTVAYWDSYAAAQYPKRKAEYEAKVAKWKKENPSGAAQGQSESQPSPPINPYLYVNRTGALYNGMVAPLTAFTIRGAVWYQGESSASKPEPYGALLSTMIHDWRRGWGIGDFPFLVVQLPNLDTSKFTSLGKDWATMREAQSAALKLPNTGMVVTIDIGRADDAHPKNKQDVGERLATLAAGMAYGRKTAFRSPMYRSMKVEDNRIRLTFDDAADGLMIRGKEARGFTIAGPDQKFVKAQAQIVGTSVLVWSERVTRPAAVRYAWTDNPDANLYRRTGLPVCPFRTDQWQVNSKP